MTKIRYILQKVINVLERIKERMPKEKEQKILSQLYTTYKHEMHDLEGRLSMLNSSKKVIVYIYEKPDYSTFRYRGYNVSKVINTSELSEVYSATYFFMDELSVVKEHLYNIAAIILIRAPYTSQLQDLIDSVKKKKTPLFYDIDDIVFELDEVETLLKMDTYSENPNLADTLYGYVYRRNAIAAQADAFITTNDFLKGILKKKFNKPCYVLPNTLNSLQVTFAKGIVRKHTHHRFVIGYFSGSSTHNQDFAIVSKSLAKLMDEYKNIHLNIGGYLSIPSELAKFKHGGRIHLLPFVNFIDQLSFVSECDLQLIPLVENKFNNSKSELKFFEAGLVHVPSIASPTYMYKKIINDGSNAMLASVDEWEDKIKKIYLDPYLKQEIADNAYKYTMENYYGERVKMQVAQLLKDIF